MHSFLDPTFLPRWSTFTAESIEPSIRQALAEAQQAIDTIANQAPDLATYASSFLALENASESLSRGWERLQHLDAVSDNPAQREAINKLLPDVTDFYSSLSLNPRLFAVLNAVAESSAAKNLTPIQQRHIEETLADFRNSGADLPDEMKARIAAIDSELSMVTKKYSENVLNSVSQTICVILFLNLGLTVVGRVCE
jgi:oligopeptidase A